MKNDGRQHGKLKWYDKSLHYGFIVPDAGGKDIFFHSNDGSTWMHVGVMEKDQAVSFLLAEGRKGPKAIDIRLEAA